MKVLCIFVQAMVLVCHPYLHTIIGLSEQTNNTLKFLGVVSNGTDNNIWCKAVVKETKNTHF